MPGSHGGACQCQHDLAAPVAGTEWLNEYMDTTNITCLNEDHPGISTRLFRPYAERLVDLEPPCTFRPEEENIYDDEQGLTISIPFSCPVKITGISVIGGDSGRHPQCLNLFANVTDASIVSEIEPSQSIDPLVEDFCGAVEYPLRVVKFGNVTSLIIHFPTSQHPFHLHWIGLRGVASGAQRKAVVTVYESRPLVADHEVRETFGVGKHIQ
jgi:hypothetical protein